MTTSDRRIFKIVFLQGWMWPMVRADLANRAMAGHDRF
jgi:hypothetical protein